MSRLFLVLGLLLLEAHLIQGYCSGMTKIVGQDSGTIAPGAGPFTESCSWEIKPGFQLSDPQRIVIGVRTWDRDAQFTLSVYDGMSDGTLLYSKMQGNSRPGEVRARLHSLATVVFTAEAGTDSSALEIYWYTSVLCSNSETVTLTDQEGSIGSGPGPYKNTMACNWLVAPGGIPDGYHVAFKLSMLDTGSEDAFVRISNGHGDKLAQYSGTDLPTDMEIICPTATCKVYWHTGEVGNRNMHTGFALQYYLSDGDVTPPDIGASPSGLSCSSWLGASSSSFFCSSAAGTIAAACSTMSAAAAAAVGRPHPLTAPCIRSTARHSGHGIRTARTTTTTAAGRAATREQYPGYPTPHTPRLNIWSCFFEFCCYESDFLFPFYSLHAVSDDLFLDTGGGTCLDQTHSIVVVAVVVVFVIFVVVVFVVVVLVVVVVVVVVEITAFGQPLVVFLLLLCLFVSPFPFGFWLVRGGADLGTRTFSRFQFPPKLCVSVLSVGPSIRYGIAPVQKKKKQTNNKIPLLLMRGGSCFVVGLLVAPSPVLALRSSEK
ncbi:hypothetical protein PAPYR_5215 [Paratrimastix pyriformis]|uniref:CUB domain-containing protein n=1 Tax=Paratrimastix pyriformis TaxID=342808 RepID=A0ABQ8UJE7_9EUKA|nr:hypothetical protein PAPYR_5215 [Paratrimastix pyriformis]